jgi:3',5'-cyclic AMP phosphodiesterase CpdA
MRNIRTLTALILLVFALAGCTVQAKAPAVTLPPKGSPLKLIVASDIHYLSPSLIEPGSQLFQLMLDTSDGKQVNYVDQITDAFVADVIRQKPNALIISGDLSFNGEKQSHLDVAKKLQKVKDAGIPVFVIPGNHDINNYNACRYAQVEGIIVDSVTPKQFNQIYGDFGWKQALYRDKNTLSYVAAVSDDLWLVMLDTSRYNDNSPEKRSDATGAVSDETLAWLRTCLDAAKAKGVEVISVTHHNLLTQNSNFQSYTIQDDLKLVSLYRDYSVRLNLSGHIHTQDITSQSLQGQTIYDVVTSSLSVYTNQYGVVDFVPGESLAYHTQPVDVEGWAKDTGSRDLNLLGFETYSYNFFRTSSYNKSLMDLSYADVTPDEAMLMANVMADLNPAYFSGTQAQVRDKVLASDAYKLWNEKKGLQRKGYIDSMLELPKQDPNNLVISLEVK